MHAPLPETGDLRLVARTRDEVRAQVAQMSEQERAQLAPAWLALLEASGPKDPWVHGFVLRRGGRGVAVGQCGFKGPPSGEGVVEIAYAVDPEHQGRGYATGAAAALVRHALADPRVRVVRAHTLPQANASTRVLTKCGFQRVGEVMDPEDGPVWRWEKVRGSAG